MAKVWLRGRACSAAIERKRGGTLTGEDFHEEHVRRGLCQRGKTLDRAIRALREAKWADWPQVLVGSHGVICRVLSDIYGKVTQRSLASKYLHFHVPDRGLIFDSRAQGALRCFPTTRHISIPCRSGDPDFRSFAFRSAAVLDGIRDLHGVSVSPREFDTLLLSIDTDYNVRTDEKAKKPMFCLPSTDSPA